MIAIVLREGRGRRMGVAGDKKKVTLASESTPILGSETFVDDMIPAKFQQPLNRRERLQELVNRGFPYAESLEVLKLESGSLNHAMDYFAMKSSRAGTKLSCLGKDRCFKAVPKEGCSIATVVQSPRMKQGKGNPEELREFGILFRRVGIAIPPATRPRMDKRPHQIYVHAIEARGVTGCDSSHTSDIHCELTIGPTSRLKRYTRTKYETNNTVFNEEFFFENVMLTNKEFSREKIGLNLYDRNDFLPNRRIGGIEFSLDNIYRQKGHEYFRKWVPCTLPEAPGKEHGFLLVSIYVLKRGDPTPERKESAFLEVADLDKKGKLLVDPNIDRKIYYLNVLIYRAEDIKATHGKSLNPFVNIRFNGQTCQTQRMATLSNPIWNRKIQMPFQLPLTSDAIEIQVWNHNTLTPDTLIGSCTVSYYEEGLTHRPWGPQWINLYSSDYTPPKHNTIFTNLADAFTGGEQVGKDEYVGRLLARLSVKSVNQYLNPRLKSLPTAPAAEPEGETYVLDFAAISATEVPVSGGKLKIEACFGPNRVASKTVLGVDGTFHFNQVLEPLEFFGTANLSQVPDLVISVYHIMGLVSRKIAFERVPIEDLLDPTSDVLYMLNGAPLPPESSPWPAQVRALQNVKIDTNRSHFIAGFLNCWIGFGVKDHRPIQEKMPTKTVEMPPLRPYNLRFHIHYGTRIPAAEDNGLSNPFVVLRFAGRTAVSSVKEATRFPVFHETLRINDVGLHPDFAPSIQVLLYHKTEYSFASHSLLGRFEIDTTKLFPARKSESDTLFPRYNSPVLRYPVHVIGMEVFKDADLPTLTAEVDLVEYDMKDPTFSRVPEKPIWEDADSLTHFTVRIDVLGIFGADPKLSSPSLRIYFPDGFEIDTTGKKPKNLPPFEIMMSKKESKDANVAFFDGTGNSVIMRSNTFEIVTAPRFDLDSVAMHVELLNGGRVTATAYLTLNTILGGLSKGPRLYETTKNKPGEEIEKTAGEIFDQLVAEEERAHQLTVLKRNYEKAKLEEKNDLFLNTDELLHGGAPVVLKEDLYNDNICIEIEKEYDGEAPQDNMEEDVKAAPEPQDASEETKNVGGFYNLTLLKGRSVGLKRGKITKKLWSNPDAKATTIPQEVAGTLKCIVAAVPCIDEEEEQKGYDEHDQEAVFDKMAESLQNYHQVYEQAYVVRVYIYRGTHFAPPPAVATDGGNMDGGCHPYLVISNGKNPENNYTSRGQTTDRCKNFNPHFSQVVELRATLPTNRILKIGVWDRPITIGRDRFIGEAKVDVEKCIFSGHPKGEQEWYTLLHPTKATSRGQILARVDILTETQAQTDKADELTGPEFSDYELRLVLWQTVGIKFPEEKDRGSDVDQKIRVTVNFSGVPGRDIMKETDTAWYAAGGSAEWNWRMVFPIRLPCELDYARIKFAVWDENLVGSGENVGEAVLNIAKLFARTLQDKEPRTIMKPTWIKFRQANFSGVNLGQIYVEAAVYTKAEAEEFPVGEAQKEPNRLPFLANPKRNAPPWALGTRALDYLGAQRLKIIITLIILLLVAIAVPIVVVIVGSQAR
ncbi:hypothetical protein AAMO2058_001315100 [Amorphochlora amoebiformis]